MRNIIGILLFSYGMYLLFTPYIGVGVLLSLIGATIADPVWDSKEIKN